MKKPRLRVREIAESQGLTANKVAQRAGISLEVAYQIWRNESSPKLDTLQKIADALGCKVTDLIDNGTEEPEQGQQKAGGTLPSETEQVPPAALTGAAPQCITTEGA
jgi:transcriptional regulator with XRE-family HTH domain